MNEELVISSITMVIVMCVSCTRKLSKIESHSSKLKYHRHIHSYYVIFTVGINGTIQLIGGSTSRQGRVEIWYNSQWNTVCDDSWDISDANVVCQQLGFRGAVAAHQSAHFGQGSGQILLDDLQCTGREASLLECSHSGINQHNCGHSEDASVTCACTV